MVSMNHPHGTTEVIGQLTTLSTTMMKAVFLFTLLALFVVVHGEPYCTDAAKDCSHMTCTSTSQQVGCLHNICTCVDKLMDTCTLAADCDSWFSHHHCSHARRHCVDGTCTCWEWHH